MSEIQDKATEMSWSAAAPRKMIGLRIHGVTAFAFHTLELLGLASVSGKKISSMPAADPALTVLCWQSRETK